MILKFPASKSSNKNLKHEKKSIVSTGNILPFCKFLSLNAAKKKTCLVHFPEKQAPK